MAPKPLVLDRDHRAAHGRRNFVIVQPAAEAGAERDQQRSVGGTHPDHLAKVGTPAQLLVIGQLGHRHGNGNAQADQAKEAEGEGPFQGGDEHSLGTGRIGAGHWR
jgi:hypothetical protein